MEAMFRRIEDYNTKQHEGITTYLKTRLASQRIKLAKTAEFQLSVTRFPLSFPHHVNLCEHSPWLPSSSPLVNQFVGAQILTDNYSCSLCELVAENDVKNLDKPMRSVGSFVAGSVKNLQIY